MNQPSRAASPSEPRAALGRTWLARSSHGAVGARACRLLQAHGLIILGALALAAGARLYAIATESLWLDEATSLILARMEIPGLIQWTAQDIHPPLYYVLLHYWIGLGQSEGVLRALSALAGVLNVAVIYWLGCTLYDARTGMYAALLLAVSPLHVWYSQETRMYAWVTLLITLSVLLAVRSWSGQRWMTWAGYVLATAAAMYTHYYAIFAILLENVFFLYLFLRRRAGGRLLGGWIIAQLAVFILYLPWFPTFLLPITVGGGGWVALGTGKPSLSALAQTVVLYMVGTGRALYPVWIRRAGYVVFLGIIALGLVPARLLSRASPGDEQKPSTPRSPLFTEHEALVFTLAYCVLAPGMAWLSSQIFKPMYSVRYMLPFLIPFLVLAARGLCNLPWAGLRVALILGLMAFMGVGLWAQVRLQDKPDWRGFADGLIARAQPGDLVVFVPGWHAKAFDYYARGALELESELPVPVPRYGDRPFALLDQAIEGHSRVWLVWETDHYTDPEGAIYTYLRQHYPLVQEEELYLVGKVALFQNPRGQPWR